jgi:BirA family biotin operon repressor/biotin-[acetyl-CoA-carboxylase] ligase
LYKIPANTLFLGQNLIFVPECHSTNSLLNDLNNQSDLAEGTVVITDKQTAGRGQRGNKWETAPGLNLTFSLLLKPRFINAKDQFRLNMAISIAIAEAFRKISITQVKLKWPNDIFLNGKKMGGILMENQIQGSSISTSVAGIGLNINQLDFSIPNATSLALASGMEHDLGAVFRQILECIEGHYLDLKNGNASLLKQRYLAALFKFREQQDFEALGENFTGIIHDVDEDGKLCVETDGAVRKFAFKEVSFVN